MSTFISTLNFLLYIFKSLVLIMPLCEIKPLSWIWKLSSLVNLLLVLIYMTMSENILSITKT